MTQVKPGDHIGNCSSWEISIVDAHSDDAEIHEPQSELSVVATVANDESPTHDGHDHGDFGACLLRLLWHIDIKVFALGWAKADSPMNSGIMVIRQHDPHEGRE